MIASPVFLLLSISIQTWALPQQEGVPITAPPKQTYTGILQIPDAAHPYIAPGPDDLRGPCPGLNTLANHGYLPRNGVASFEEIVNATMHGFNMEYDFSSAITAFGMLARGNAYINKLSLGQDTPLVPPLPGAIDGPKARGLSAHGRFEGDGSMTRQDAAIGDNVHFQPKLFAELLDIVAQLGDDSPSTGPHSIINKQSLSLFKFNRFQESQASNVKMQYHIGRLFLSYAETGIVLKIFANGTDGTLSVPTLTSILRDQRFPDGWFRRSSPATFKDIVASTLAVFLSRPVLPGANSPSGIYIPDISIPGFCAFYANLASDNLPGALLNTTGVLKDNVDFLLKAIHNIFPRCPRADPRGPANA